MGSLYKHGKFISTKRMKAWQWVVAVILFIAIAIGIFVYLDVNEPLAIDDSENSPVTAAVIAGETALKKIEEPSFTMSIPDDWVEVERSPNNDYIKYHATADANIGRSLEIYINNLPADTDVNRLMPISTAAGTINTGQISDRCHTFTDYEKDPDRPYYTPEPSLARWKGVEFMCDFGQNQELTGTGSVEEGELTTIKGKTTENRYYFQYVDATGKTDFTYFVNALESFKAL